MQPQATHERPAKITRVAPVKTKSRGTVATPGKPSVSACDDVQVLIARRAYELFAMRGYRDGYALDDWLEAEREVLSQIPSV